MDPSWACIYPKNHPGSQVTGNKLGIQKKKTSKKTRIQTPLSIAGTLPKTNMDTQNDAIFEAGDTS